jgi:hypothetical protein
METYTRSRFEIESQALPGPSAVIRMADSVELLATIKDSQNVVAQLDLIFHDTNESFHEVRPPTQQDACQILDFVHAHAHVPNLVIQCQAGVGRSRAVLAALLKMYGDDPKSILHEGTYNRSLYRMLLAVAGIASDPEPLVSMNVRVKYAPDRLKLFLLAMQRQRYENWEVVAVTDGPNDLAARLVAEMQDPRIRLIQTERRLGCWGHPYRQLGLDACRGEFIGLSNDDNYYVPGYLEQMLHALEDADIAMCQILHSYVGWEPTFPGEDLGSWIARTPLVRQVPWPGNYFEADRQYIKSLTELPQVRVAKVNRNLFVHN